MENKQFLKAAFVGSFVPRKCGIATFTCDLINNISMCAGDKFEPLVAAMDTGQGLKYPEMVKFEVRRNVKNDYVCAADYINFSHVDVISVQHEYGLFGGDAGTYLNLLLDKINAPVITTCHTVLEEPEEDYYRSTLAFAEASDKIVVMNERGIRMLREIYGVDDKKIVLIPHGIPDLPFVDSSYYKHKFGMEGRRTILTFGLLSKNKGIEMMLEAMPAVVKQDPSVLYIILGATHPGVVKHEGEAYRFSLQHKVKALGLQDNVIFHNRYVNSAELHNFLCAADLYVTPYMNKEQLTSGTLAFAVGAGKAVISTPYWAAEELLADDRGKLVKFGDSNALAEAIIQTLKDEKQFYSMRRKAYDYGRDMTWPAVGKMYWELFNKRKQMVSLPSKAIPSIEKTISILEVPEPPLEHLIRLTDDTGLIQHAKFVIPDRKHGYCTDDNARGVVAMTKYYSQYAEPEALRLFDTYLSFLHHAQQGDGTVKNFMDYDRSWIENEPEHDALPRTLWALGSVIANPPLPRYISIIKDCFDRSVKHVPTLSIRGLAYAIFGMSDYLKQFPGASDIKRHFEYAADFLLEKYNTNSRENWCWYEDILAYDNAVLPHALYIAARVTGRDDYLEAAENTCRFLIENTYDGNHFSFIGCNGWYKRGAQRAKFDQQPIEVAGTVMMLREAYEITGNTNLLKLQKKAFDWFLGDNDLHMPVYDFRTKGSGDGLEAGGINLNQGAESLLSFLLSLLCVVESYSSNGAKMLEQDDSTKEGTIKNGKIRPTRIKALNTKGSKDDKMLEKLF